MQIEFTLVENVNGTRYSVQITSPDGEVFHVTENGTRYRVYETRAKFLEDFEDLESWFWPVDVDE